MITLVLFLLAEAQPALIFPIGWIGWTWFLLSCGALVWTGGRWFRFQRAWRRGEWAFFGMLAMASVFTSIFIGLRLSLFRTGVVYDLLLPADGFVLMVFAALPWIIAAGFLGPIASLTIAAFSGLILANYNTNSAFTVVEYAWLGLLVGAAFQQPYRTPYFRALRHPLISCLLLAVAFPILFIINMAVGYGQGGGAYLDYALANVPDASLALGGSVMLAALFAEVAAFGFPSAWGSRSRLIPSPAERSLETRTFNYLVPVVGITAIVLAVLAWRSAVNTAEELMKDRLQAMADLAAASLPAALEAGQLELIEIGRDNRLASQDAQQMAPLLAEFLQGSDYFQQFLIVDRELNVLAASGLPGEEAAALVPQEQVGAELALQGVPFQYYAVDPGPDQRAASLSFVVALPYGTEPAARVLLARTRMEANPFFNQAFAAMAQIDAVEGEGLLLDQGGRILAHSLPGLVFTSYSGELPDQPGTFRETGPRGARDLVHYFPLPGQPWSIVLRVPTQAIQSQALSTVAPFLGLLLFLLLVLIVLLRWVLRLVTRSLRNLAVEASRIAHDQQELARPLAVGGVDEVGRMRAAFEHMRASLQQHLEEQNEYLLRAEVEHQRLAAILASTPDPVLVTDQRNHLLLANPAAWGVLGVSGSQSIAGQPIRRVLRQPELIELLESAGDEYKSQEFTAVDGRVYVAKATSVVADGQRMGSVCVLRDVTSYKEIDAMKSEFVSTVSHDLRNPLTLLHGYTTMIRMLGELGEQQETYVRKIITGINSMSRLVNNLLDLGRIEAGVDLDVALIPVADVVADVVDNLQLQAAQNDQRILVEYVEDAMPLVEADQDLLHRALYNLVENGLKYSSKGGQVEIVVHASRQSETILFEIRDCGEGISEADQLRLFERFYRGKQKEIRKRRGTGLGLAIVKSIAERHAGTVWVESEAGKGSTFFFKIPVKQENSA